MKIDFLIMYEVRVRELESVFLLGTELENRGYSVEYISFDEVSHNAYLKNRKKLKKYYNNVRIVLMPSLYHNSEIYNTVYYVCGQCDKIVNLRWEQYFANKEMQNPESVLFPQEDAKKAYHVCWGKRSYESLLAAGVSETTLLQTGALHLDFLRPEFSGIYLEKVQLLQQYSIPQLSKTVLFLSSFVTATRTERSRVNIQNDFDGKYDFHDDVYRFHVNSYELTLEWIEAFLIENPETYFIYRPHPSENITAKIEQLLSKYQNFKIISDYSVKQWIVTCDVVTTWISTSIVEAYYAGKACFIVRPIPYDKEYDMSVYQGAKFITDKQEFINIIKRECEMSVSEEIIHYYYDVQDKASYVRLSDKLELLMHSEDCFPWDIEEMKKFDKKRKTLWLRNSIFNCYYMVLGVFAYVKEKTGIYFGHYFESRILNYQTNKKKAKYNALNEKSFDSTKERIENYYSQLKA